MRLEVTDKSIRTTIDELVAQGMHVTNRSVRAELKRRFGCVGNSIRVHRQLRIFRDELARRDLPHEQVRAELRRALKEAEEWKQRAELAQHRERAHQDKWALEVHRLREQVREARRENLKSNALSDQYLKLYADRARLADRIAELERQLAGLQGGRAPA